MLAATFGMLIWAQNQVGRQNPFGGTPGSPAAPGSGELVGLLVQLVISLLLAVVALAGLWKIFDKAGEPGWAAIVPFYNLMILSKICGRGMGFGLLAIIPCVNIVVMLMLSLDLAKAFGKSAGFGIGIFFLNFVFWPILGFGDAEYIGVGGESRGRRRRRDDDDDDDDYDDEEEERPRRSAPKDTRTQKRPSAPPPPAPKRRPPVDDDEDEEEERPRPKRR